LLLPERAEAFPLLLSPAGIWEALQGEGIWVHMENSRQPLKECSISLTSFGLEVDNALLLPREVSVEREMDPKVYVFE